MNAEQILAAIEHLPAEQREKLLKRCCPSAYTPVVDLIDTEEVKRRWPGALESAAWRFPGVTGFYTDEFRNLRIRRKIGNDLTRDPVWLGWGTS